jgi:methylenetetrahydrofolate reductase (NADPH)
MLSGPGVSFELFPPKTPQGMEKLLAAMGGLASLSPRFVSITSGAGGSGREEETTSVVRSVMGATGLPVMPHLTCMGRTGDDLLAILRGYHAIGVRNILALRGDRKPDSPPAPPGAGFHALDLIRLVSRHFGDGFCVGGSAYIEPHPESLGRERDFHYMKEKEEAGMAFAVTQLFFDNRIFYDYLDACARHGITLPILPGIFTITDGSWIKEFSATHRVTIPPALRDALDRHAGDADAIRKIGIDHTLEQVRDLAAHGVHHLHIYTMNRSEIPRTVLQAFTDACAVGPPKEQP